MTSCGLALREGGVSGWIMADRAENRFSAVTSTPALPHHLSFPTSPSGDSGAASSLVLKQGTQR